MQIEFTRPCPYCVLDSTRSWVTLILLHSWKFMWKPYCFSKNWRDEKLFHLSAGVKMWNASRFCVSSLRHANLLCIVPILVYVLPKQVHLIVWYHAIRPKQLISMFFIWFFCKSICGNEKKSRDFRTFLQIFFVRSILKSVLIKPQDEIIKTNLPPVRLELTAFRLWDWRAAYCATEAHCFTWRSKKIFPSYV